MWRRFFFSDSPPAHAQEPHFGAAFPVDTAAPPASPEEIARCQARLGSPIPVPLVTFLTTRCNGGTFAGGLLHLLGAARPLRHDDLATWNQPGDWKSAYAGFDLEQWVFFADDIFGNQFGYQPGSAADPAVHRFDIHLGAWTEICPSLAQFLATQLAAEGPWLLGADFVQAYRDSGAACEAGRHLGMVIPALLGGSLEPENLRPVEPTTNLFVAGQVVTKIKPLPPGTEVRGFRVDDAARSVSFETRAPR